MSLGGRERVEELCAKYPEVARSIIIKLDVLREGVRYSRDLEEAGSWSLPFFLLWNPTHAENPETREKRLFMVPWKFDLGDGPPVKVVVQERSPWEIRKNGGDQYVLFRDGEEIDEVSFEMRPEWYMTALEDGKLLPTIIQLFSTSCLFGCILRYCEYSRSKEQCRYCSLDSAVEDFKKRGFDYTVSAKPEEWAEGFRRALDSGAVRHISFTGGSLLDTHKEALQYSRNLAALTEVREERGSSAIFEVCVTAMAVEDQKLLKDSGLDVLAHHMDTWEEKLWPEIIPGKNRHIGREKWLAALERAVEIFGWGNVQSNFVVGAETACPGGIRDIEEGVESWRACFSHLFKRGIIPRTTVWQPTEGSAYVGKETPSTEYFIRVGYERYRLMKEYKMHDQGRPYPCHRCNCWSSDTDFTRLLDGCRCGQCA